MGIELIMPNTIGLASNSTKKLLSKTPPVPIEKTAAKTPSIVEALKLVRIASLEIRGLSVEVGESVVNGEAISAISKERGAPISTGTESISIVFNNIIAKHSKFKEQGEFHI